MTDKEFKEAKSKFSKKSIKLIKIFAKGEKLTLKQFFEKAISLKS